MRKSVVLKSDVLSIKLPEININNIYDNLNRKKGVINNFANVCDVIQNGHSKNISKAQGVKSRNYMTGLKEESQKNKFLLDQKMNLKNFKYLNMSKNNYLLNYAEDDHLMMIKLMSTIAKKKEDFKYKALSTKNIKTEFTQSDCNLILSTKASDRSRSMRNSMRMNEKYSKTDSNIQTSTRVERKDRLSSLKLLKK